MPPPLPVVPARPVVAPSPPAVPVVPPLPIVPALPAVAATQLTGIVTDVVWPAVTDQPALAPLHGTPAVVVAVIVTTSFVLAGKKRPRLGRR